MHNLPSTKPIPQYRALYVQYLADYVLPANQRFLFSEYQAKFNQLFALYGDQATNDTVDPDPMGLAGFEKQYFVDKTKNVLDQLGLDHAGYEVE